MSRTDKDDPAWVRAETWSPQHRCWSRACDLPPEPRRVHPDRPGWLVSLRRGGRWFWWPDRTERTYGAAALRGFSKTHACRTLFHRPGRRAAHDAARAVVRGDREREFPDGRARGSIRYLLI